MVTDIDTGASFHGLELKAPMKSDTMVLRLETVPVRGRVQEVLSQ